MDISIEKTIQRFVNHNNKINNIYYSHNNFLAPLLAYHVDFPRVEIILDGELEVSLPNEKGEHINQLLYPCDILYIEANNWNQPIWQKPVTTLNILFGKQQLGISLLHWDGQQLILREQRNVPRKGPRIGAFIINALSELIWKNTIYSNNKTFYFLIQSLLSHTLDLLTVNIETSAKTTNLFEGIQQYIDTHFHEDINRDFLAKMFYISPNYLSYLFQREGKIGLNEYINQVRLEYAKTLLKRYDLNIKEISQTVGFHDSNYFCRIFKKKTERSPTEYRRQYHSKISQK